MESSRSSMPTPRCTTPSSRGGGRFQSVNDRLQNSTDRRHGVERDLLDALEGDELRLHFQPIVSVTTGRWDGVEALLRWDHPRVGAVAPETIVAAAERAGLALELGSWVLRNACRQMREWIDSGGSRPASIAVNVSAPELLHPLHCTRVEAAIRECELPPAALCLELTESILVADARAAVDVLKTLERIGVALALDDFGTGYSSLNYLKRFPVSVVKIDRTFIADLAEDPVDEAIVVAVIDLAHTLGLKVVAEGVETPDQRDHVISLGCDHIQGFLYSPPVPSAEIPTTAPWAVGLNGHAGL
jgi:EAL domain-containing protein (putative c-di-GMP-specific phosphodiesterase class I)